MARQVPVAAFPFPALVNETLTVQAPVAGAAMVNETSATPTQPGGGAFVVVAA